MFHSTKFLILILSLGLMINLTGCSQNNNMPLVQSETKEKPKTEEKQYYNDRGVEKGANNPTKQESKTPTPAKVTASPTLVPVKKTPADVMAQYDKAIELDKKGNTDDTIKAYKDFVDSASKLEKNGVLKNPTEKEKMKKAMEQAKKRIDELSKIKDQQTNNQKTIVAPSY